MNARLDHHNLLIDGRPVAALSGRTFETLDPATEDVIAVVAEADGVEVINPITSPQACQSAITAASSSAVAPRMRAVMMDRLPRPAFPC